MALCGDFRALSSELSLLCTSVQGYIEVHVNACVVRVGRVQLYVQSRVNQHSDHQSCHQFTRYHKSLEAIRV